MEVRMVRRCSHCLADYSPLRGAGKRPSHLVSGRHQVGLVGGTGVEWGKEGICPNVASRLKAKPIFISCGQCVVASLDLANLPRRALRQSGNLGEPAGEP